MAEADPLLSGLLLEFLQALGMVSQLDDAACPFSPCSGHNFLLSVSALATIRL